ncbi:MAG: 23S rRNA (adenine(2503)-C(2))-methyltransferase RlmN [Anaerolineales bacterium]|nr:23S rRNA (adenine(2503)-C(2))-methyltransferase RlmN [Anaerolineales bacterium]
MTDKPLIYDLSINELEQVIQDWGEPGYRAAQIWTGLYRQLWCNPDDFTTLSKGLRERLKENFTYSYLSPGQMLISKDGWTEKIRLNLHDGRAIETVIMQSRRRNTICISTQVGCAIGCTFCATGQMGFKRNLTQGEIVEQVIYCARTLAAQGRYITNVVAMGMGEPFQNYDATMSAIDCLNHPAGFNLGQRNFTVSTVGIIPGIKRFTTEHSQVNLSVSLHAADDDLRNTLVPVNKKYPLEKLLQECKNYVSETRRRITFEWALIQDTNDTPEQARLLARLLHGILCHINLILLNPTPSYVGKASSQQRAEQFRAVLEHHGIPCTLRFRRGIEIQAGCGQLATK